MGWSKNNYYKKVDGTDHPFFYGIQGKRSRYTDDQGKDITRYVHLWHRTGQVLDPLLQLAMPANNRQQVQLDVIYPPDSTPPQALTVRTLASKR